MRSFLGKCLLTIRLTVVCFTHFALADCVHFYLMTYCAVWPCWAFTAFLRLVAWHILMWPCVVTSFSDFQSNKSIEYNKLISFHQASNLFYYYHLFDMFSICQNYKQLKTSSCITPKVQTRMLVGLVATPTLVMSQQVFASDSCWKKFALKSLIWIQPDIQPVGRFEIRAAAVLFNLVT